MIRKLIHFTLKVVPVIALMIISISFSDYANAQTRAQAKSAAEPMKLQASTVKMSELKRFCDRSRTTSSKRGGTTTYSCQTKPAGGGKHIQANPGVARSEIDCSYSESGGVTKWLGCTCKANDEGNCNAFITNCVGEGDNVEGNSGGASCSP